MKPYFRITLSMHLIDCHLIWRMIQLPRAALSSACARSVMRNRAFVWLNTNDPSVGAGLSVRAS